MSLAGEGAVAIWHDIAPEAREEFYAWHGEEHMPERVGIPGFLRGRRYVAMRAGLEFFNLYEALSPQVVAGSDYLTRLNSPTTWTVATVRHFKNVARSICRVVYSTGRGHGGLIATLRYDIPNDTGTAHIAAMTERLLPPLARQRGVAGMHLLMADIGASAVKTEEQKARAGANRIPGWILLVEGWGDYEPFMEFCESKFSPDDLKAAGASGPVEVGFYRLQTTRTKTDWSLG